MSISFIHYISISKEDALPVYLQIANGVIHLIKTGVLKACTRLPGSRHMAEQLGVHRKTVISAIEELQLQGWLEVYPQKGTFVSADIPELKAESFIHRSERVQPKVAAFQWKASEIISLPQLISERLQFNDGLPDVRLAPLKALAGEYSGILKGRGKKKLFAYGDQKGNLLLRSAHAEDLNTMRGLNITEENIMITRGSAMAIYLVSRALINNGDYVVVGETSYELANTCFQEAGARLVTVTVDEDGIVVEEVEEWCKQKDIKALYITSHHHHPTTVTLSPERRISLLQLAEKYRFAIVEDDYDYDFHYLNRPVLPLISADREGLVIYIGSFSKKMAPAFRVGYVVAPVDFIEGLRKYRRIVDLQGDPVLEQAIGALLKEGVIKRYTQKALKAYRERRDCLTSLLEQRLKEEISFKISKRRNGSMGEIQI